MTILAAVYFVAATVTAILPAWLRSFDETLCLRLAQVMALVGIGLALLGRP